MFEILTYRCSREPTCYHCSLEACYGRWFVHIAPFKRLFVLINFFAEYVHDDTNVFYAFYRAVTKCTYVEDDCGIAFPRDANGVAIRQTVQEYEASKEAARIQALKDSAKSTAVSPPSQGTVR